jgi:acyl-coenzyme A synthetase/AMP-(fatty) acid ligase
MKQVNIADELSRQAAETPDATAIHVPRREISYRELEILTWRATAVMFDDGIRPGDVVALSMANELTLWICCLAGARIGATVFTLPTGLPAIQRMEMLNAVGAGILVRDGEQADADGLRTLIMDFSLLSKERGQRSDHARDGNPQAHCFIEFGSGSTGTPKLIPYTHNQFSEIARRTVRRYGMVPGDRLATLVSLNFVSTKRRYLSALMSGASVVLFNRLKDDPISLVNDNALNILIGTVFHIERLVNSLPETASGEMDRLRLLEVTSSEVSMRLRAQIAAKLTTNLLISYGTNECTAVTVSQSPEVFETAGTVGYPMPGVEVEIVNKSDNPVPPGRTGLVKLRAPGMVEGYLDNPEATRRAFRNGWFYPGDLGHFTPEGQLIYDGRADHMMIMSGVNIYPAEIERVVSSYPGVRDTAVVPFKHRSLQDLPVCSVAPNQHEEIDIKALQAYARERLGAKTPPIFAILADIPRSERGKLQREELYRLLRAKLGGTADQS